uniref:Uncharacterized protein n=1 Tax=Sipha flava TaxID=143950 RepID=A0A2S2QTH5_9HEMI
MCTKTAFALNGHYVDGIMWHHTAPFIRVFLHVPYGFAVFRLPTPNDQNLEKPTDYRPPVPPHRSQLNADHVGDDEDDEQAPPPPPKRHHHHHHHHRNRSQGGGRSSVTVNNTNNNNDHPKAPERNSDPLFVETCNRKSMDVKRAAIIGNPMFAFDPSAAPGDQKIQNAGGGDTIKLDDLNLGMDYKQLMEYFDNLKESNA